MTRDGNSKTVRTKAGTTSRFDWLRFSAITLALIVAGNTADAQTDPITFFGVEVPGDNFVWCIDRGGSMSGEGLYDDLRAELTDTLLQLDGSNEFGLVMINGSALVTFPLQPALPSTVTSAIMAIDSIPPAILTDTVPTVNTAAWLIESSGLPASIVLVGDGELTTFPYAPPYAVIDQILSVIPAGIPIHTYCLTLDPFACDFYEALSLATGGIALTPPPIQNTILRGDSNGDGVVNIADPIYSLAYKFIPGSPAPPCADAADADDNGALEVTDAVVVFSALFTDGFLPPPGTTCGPDTTIDLLDCAFQNCP